MKEFIKIFPKVYPGQYSVTKDKYPSGVFHRISIKGKTGAV